MKKGISLSIINIMYLLLIVGTIVTFFIVYKNINSSLAIKFVIGYVMFLFLFPCYFIFMIISNARKLKWVEIRKRLFRFITLFILFGALNYIGDYVFRPSKIDLFREFSVSLGSSFSITFYDLMFFRKKKN